MRIHRLDRLVAQRIAAGEVVERPASVIRELIDNSIDAGASEIVITLTNGGIDEICLTDNGSGIARDDLPLCFESHATSKLQTLDDLYHITSMGFRGEALYSISSVAEVTIESNGYSIVSDNGTISDIEKSSQEKGTRITVKDLFLQIPARRQFLKRSSSEALMCRNTMLEKAYAFPEIEFRLYSNNSLVIELPAADRKKRICDIMKMDNGFREHETIELTDEGSRYSIYALCSTPSIYRSDRSQIKVFVNNRIIDEYSLVQAVTHGYGELLPGGRFPYCALFITLDPTLVDFNIHPAKREAKIRNKAEIHHAVSTMVADGIIRTIAQARPVAFNDDEIDTSPNLYDDLPQYSRPAAESSGSFRNSEDRYRSSTERNAQTFPSLAEEKPADPMWFEKAKTILKKEDSAETSLSITNSSDNDTWETIKEEGDTPVYIGQAFRLFLIAQRKNELYFIDQHAAHERILYEKFKNRNEVQTLLIPVQFDVERDVDGYLLRNSDLYANMGIRLSRKDELLWEILTLPAVCRTVESRIVEYISQYTGDIDELEAGIWAIVSCKAAIKAGDTITDAAARELVEKVFELKEPVCPHGRTFIVKMTEEDLRLGVGRFS